MNYDVDICLLDSQIRNYFESREKELPSYKEKLNTLKSLLQDSSISYVLKKNILEEIEEITNKIIDFENKLSYNFYIIETSNILEEYKEILKKPVKMSFTGKKNAENKEKNDIVKKFIQVAEKYYEIKVEGQNSLKSSKLIYVCYNCGNKKNYDIIDGKTYICIDCGSQQDYFLNSSSYKDVNRVNISSKYTYERRIHFRDCINQYQGKQNSTIKNNVYDDIEKQLEIHGLINPDKTLPKDERYAKVTKDHIFLFLKETGHTKHYEDVFLIYHKITGKKLDDISYLEQQLMDDFDVLSALYDKKYKVDKKISRKSFINSQYVLLQLLKRHKHACRKEDFNVLKTLDRKSFHDDICKDLFEELGWNFHPTF